MRATCAFHICVFLGAITALCGQLYSAAPDLTGLSDPILSDDYEVRIDGREHVVYKTVKNVSHGTHDITNMSFLGFDLQEPARIEVRPRKTVTRYEVRPYAANVVTTLSDNVIALGLDKPQHVVVLVNGSYESALVLSANPPDAPPKPQDVQHYFVPGVHRIGAHLPLKSGDRVYLAEGAILVGGFDLDRVQDVHITGRGMLALGGFPHQENFRVFRGTNTSDVLIEGITVCNAPGWIVSFWETCTGLTVRNLKIVGSFRYNTDGVQTGTTGLLVEDCFLQCNDDNFSLNGLCHDVVIRNNVLWNLYNGGVFMLGWATGRQFDLRNMHIHDNIILRVGGCCEYDRKGPFSMKLFGSNRSAQDISFRNIVIEDIAPYGNWVDFQAGKASQSTVRDITFENIEIRRAWQVGGELHGMSLDNPMEDIHFREVRIEGRLMETPTDGGLNLINTRGVTVQGVPVADGSYRPQAPAAVHPAPGNTVSPSPAMPVPAKGPNLLTNPGFADGLSGWAAVKSDQCRLAVVPGPEGRSGATAKVIPLKTGASGLQQDVTDILRRNGPGVYTYAAWVRAASGVVSVKLTLRLADKNGSQQHPSPSVKATADTWQQVYRSQRIAWDELAGATLVAETDWGESGEFFVDDCLLSR